MTVFRSAEGRSRSRKGDVEAAHNQNRRINFRQIADIPLNIFLSAITRAVYILGELNRATKSSVLSGLTLDFLTVSRVSSNIVLYRFFSSMNLW